MRASIPSVLAALALATTLPGCTDYTTEIEVTSPGHATAISTWHIASGGLEKYDEFYTQFPPLTGPDGKPKKVPGFCETMGGTQTDHPDGSATCVRHIDGDFAEVGSIVTGRYAEDHPVLTTEDASTVRVSIDPKRLVEAYCDNPDEPVAAETDAWIRESLEGHSVMFRFSGGAIGETNMTVLPGGQAAEWVIPFYDLFRCRGDIPSAVYADIAVQ